MVFAPGEALGQSDVVNFVTYLGGSSLDQGNAVIPTPDGDLIVVGSTFSSDFPVLNAFQSELAGSFDAFVARLDPDGEAIVWSTYLGGSGTDFAEEVRLTPEGDILVLGTTGSDDFPVLDAFQPNRAGEDDAFLARLDGNGTLLASSYYGGSDDDTGHDLAVFDFNGDGATDYCIVGTTSSADLPLTDPLQATLGGGNDAFFTCIDHDFVSGPLTATYLGGSGTDTGNALAIDEAGNAYVTGATTSADFATTGRTAPVESDVFLAEFFFDQASTAYTARTVGLPPGELPAFDGDDEGWDLAYFGGKVYLSGDTHSSAFTTTGDALQADPYPNDNSDGFLMIYDVSDLSAPVYATVFGGVGEEHAWSVDVSDASGQSAAFRSVELGGAGEAQAGANASSGETVKVVGTTDSFTMIDGIGQFGSGAIYSLTFTTEGGFFDLRRYGTTSSLTSQNGNGNYASGQSTFGQPIAEGIRSVQRSEAGGGDAIIACFSPPATAQTTLEVTKEADNVTPSIGDEIVYTITVTNTGAVPATDLKVTDFASPEDFGLGPLINSVLSDFTSADNSTQEAIETPPLESGESRVFTLRGLYAKDVLVDPGGTLINLASVSAFNAPEMEASAAIHPKSRLESDLWVDEIPQTSGKAGAQAAGAIDLWLDGERVIDDLEPGTATGFVSYDVGRTEPVFRVVDGAAADDSAPLDSVATDLMFPLPDTTLAFSDTTVFVLAGEVAQDLRLLVRHDARTVARDPAKVEFFMAHVLSGAGALDLRILDDTEAHDLVDVPVDDLPEDTVSAYVALDPGAYNLAITSAGGDSLLNVFRVDWTAAAGQAFTLVLSEGPGLSVIDKDGLVLPLAVVTATEGPGPVPVVTRLGDGYPNPFRTATTFPYTLGTPGPVRLDVYDLLGRRVRMLVRRTLPAGTYEAVWDGLNDGGAPVAQGVYLLRLEASGVRQSRRIVKVR